VPLILGHGVLMSQQCKIMDYGYAVLAYVCMISMNEQTKLASEMLLKNLLAVAVWQKSMDGEVICFYISLNCVAAEYLIKAK